MIFLASRITIHTAEFTAIIRIDSIAAPKPIINQLIFIQDSLELLFKIAQCLSFLFRSANTGEYAQQEQRGTTQ